MLKKLVFAVVPMLLIATSVMAEDDLFGQVAKLDASSIQDAQIAIEDASLDGLDVDALASNAGENSDQAIEACFRRFGYRHCGWGYNYGYSYNCYSPCYTYYQPLYCYRPVTYVQTYSPCYVSYWGCY
ncbi:MAG: hypothetical protein KDA71_19265 [Planctomycetales bacterium]|nr:hypothetical protein [Planctomycetales bacterium]